MTHDHQWVFFMTDKKQNGKEKKELWQSKCNICGKEGKDSGFILHTNEETCIHTNCLVNLGGELKDLRSYIEKVEEGYDKLWAQHETELKDLKEDISVLKKAISNEEYKRKEELKDLKEKLQNTFCDIEEENKDLKKALRIIVELIPDNPKPPPEPTYKELKWLEDFLEE